MAIDAPVLTKLKHDKQHYVKISCTLCGLNSTTDVDSIGRN